MKMQIEVRHVQLGHKWHSEVVEVTQEEFAAATAVIKESLDKLTYLEMDGDILPGEFIRNHCVISFHSWDD
jgi:hypothetical protein